MKSLLACAITSLLLGLSVSPLRAQAPEGAGYAIVIGSNLGGPGQAGLRYAEQDAWRVADVLTSIGGYSGQRVERLYQPTSQQLMAALERARTYIAELTSRGEPARFLFYYWGHARSDALNLGTELVPLRQLRERIVAVTATLSIVVLDACQSGAFSRAKGAEPTADFSFNSVGQLNTRGIAVIASSSEKELSQESEQLHSSYFTHHWLVALRGGGDRDADGRVTLSEAYQYAYNHTLATTATTAIGEQHATLETNLTGKDEVALTQPAAAKARLRVPESWHGRMLLQNLPSWAVFAELDKVRGHDLTLAVPAGAYAATLRGAGPVSRCELTLRNGAETQLDVRACKTLSAEELGGAKGALRAVVEGMVVELAVGFGSAVPKGAYAKRLGAFDFRREESTSDILRFNFAVGWRLLPNLLVAINYFSLQPRDFVRDVGVKQHFGWTAHALNLFVQGDLPIYPALQARLFARLGAGISIAWTSLDALVTGSAFSEMNASFQDTTQLTQEVSQTLVRPCGFAGVGVFGAFSENVGLQVELRYVFAPALENAFSEFENLGGFALSFGFRVRTSD